MCLLLCACSESPEQSEKPDEVISIIDRGGIPETVPSQGGTYGVRFSSRENWFVALYYTDSAANWISVSPMSGDSGDGEIFISLKSNTTLADRKCFVRIMAGDSQTTIEIGQARQNSVSLSSQQFWLDAAAGEFQIQVQANVVYQVKIEADWIELASPENESLLTFRAKVNVGDTRTGTIVVSGGGVSAKAEVTQFAPSEIIRFPDAKFKSYLMRYDITGDGEISRQEALRVETISCGGMEIESLEGIEYFPNLTSLHFSNNQVRRLDLSRNTKLNSLGSRFNPLEWHFEALTSESFEIISSRMTTLGVYSDMSSQWNNLDLRIVDVSGCPMLESLGCSWGNPKLEEIWLKKGQTTRVSCDSENVRILYK